MGACSPAPVIDQQMHERIMKEIIAPVVRGMRAEGMPYTGFLYAGLMITPEGTPRVLEFNCRFGDPECQPLMMRLKGDLIEIMWATATGQLHEVSLDWDKRAACCIVMSSAGYPGSYEKGIEITGVKEAEALADDGSIKVFHAGTRINKDGQLVTGGGRVLGVTALGATLAEARDLAVKGCETIQFEGAHYRRDIAWRALENATPASRT